MKVLVNLQVQEADGQVAGDPASLPIDIPSTDPCGAILDHCSKAMAAASNTTNAKYDVRTVMRWGPVGPQVPPLAAVGDMFDDGDEVFIFAIRSPTTPGASPPRPVATKKASVTNGASLGGPAVPSAPPAAGAAGDDELQAVGRRAQVQWQVGNWRSARELWHRMLELDKGCAEALRGRGRLQHLVGKSRRGARLLEQARKAGDRSITLLVELGEAQSAAGRHDDAMKSFDDALGLVMRRGPAGGAAPGAYVPFAVPPSDDAVQQVDIMLAMSRALMRAGQDMAGVQILNGVIGKGNDSHPGVLLLYARVLHGRGDVSGALAPLLKAAAARPQDKEVKRLLAACVGQEPEGSRLLLGQMSLAPSAASALSFLADMVKSCGATRAAAELFREAAVREPTSAQHARSLVHVLQCMGMVQEAWDVLVAFYRRNPDQSVAAVAVGSEKEAGMSADERRSYCAAAEARLGSDIRRLACRQVAAVVNRVEDPFVARCAAGLPVPPSSGSGDGSQSAADRARRRTYWRGLYDRDAKRLRPLSEAPAQEAATLATAGQGAWAPQGLAGAASDGFAGLDPAWGVVAEGDDAVPPAHSTTRPIQMQAPSEAARTAAQDVVAAWRSDSVLRTGKWLVRWMAEGPPVCLVVAGELEGGAAEAEAAAGGDDDDDDQEALPDAPSATWRVIPPQQEELMALHLTAVKLAYMSGLAPLLPPLIGRLESVRRGMLLHTTSVRNEAAYYGYICRVCELLLQGVDIGAEEGEGRADWDVSAVSEERLPVMVGQDLLPTADGCGDNLFVIGDSHTLTPAWTRLLVQGERRLCVPALVTGVKSWHLRPASNFYPKVNFREVVRRVPEGADLLMLIGEIDCREGILAAFSKTKYRSVEHGIEVVVGHYMAVLEQLVRRRRHRCFVQPAAPVLDPTRHIVTEFNKQLKAAVTAKAVELAESDASLAGKLVYADVFPQLLTPETRRSAAICSGASAGLPLKFNQAFDFDGTHMHPRYLAVLSQAIDDALANQ